MEVVDSTFPKAKREEIGRKWKSGHGFVQNGNQRGCATIHGTKMIQPKVQYWEQQAPGQCRLPLNSTRTAGRGARHEAIPCLGATLGFVGPLQMEGPATAVAVNTLKPCSRIGCSSSGG